MVNHDAPHQLSGRGSSWVTSWRVDEGVVIQAARRRKVYHDRDIFTGRLEPIKKKCAVVAGFRRAFRFSTWTRRHKKDVQPIAVASGTLRRRK
jgi:hypothetical protein